MRVLRATDSISHASLDSMPAELLLLIFEHASHRSGDLINVEKLFRLSGGQSELATCALVCRRWSSLVPRILYRDIVLSRTDLPSGAKSVRTFRARVDQLERTLKSVSAFGDFVDFLHIDVGRQAQYGDAYEEIGGDDVDFATLTDIARLVRLAPHIRHISLTLESTPFMTAFSTEDLQALATVASTVRHFTFNDFRPICHGDDGEQQPQLTSQGVGEERGTRRDDASFDVLLQCLQSWPSIEALAICGSHNANEETENGASTEVAALVLPNLRELQMHDHTSLPLFETPHLKSLEWIHPAAEVVSESRSRVLNLDRLSFWDLQETLDLTMHQTVQQLRLDCARPNAWETLRYLPSAVSELVVSGVDAQRCLQQLERAVVNSQSLRKIVLVDRPRLLEQKFAGTPLPKELVTLCDSRGIEVARNVESADASWNIMRRSDCRR